MDYSKVKDFTLDAASYARLMASNDHLRLNNGAKLDLYSSSILNTEEENGCFKLSAKTNNGNYIDLIGDGKGNLTWDGVLISSSGINFDEKYLKLDGSNELSNYTKFNNNYLRLDGTNKMSGHIHVNNTSLKSFTLGYPYSDKSGALLSLRGANYETTGQEGTFNLMAINGENSKALMGYPNGKLTWGGKNLVTENQLDEFVTEDELSELKTGIRNLIDSGYDSREITNGTSKSQYVSWFKLYNDGWIEQGGLMPGAAVADGMHNYSQLTFLKPFYNEDYTFICFSTCPSQGYTLHSIAYDKTSSSIKLILGQYASPGNLNSVYFHNWYACGPYS